MLKCLRKTNRIDFNFLCQVIEIPRGSKVKYELDKKTGLIKVKQCWLSKSLVAKLYFLPVLIFPVFHFNVCACAGGPCPVFISCLPSQLWIHSSHTLWRQWSFGCTGYNAGMLLLFYIIESQNGISVMVWAVLGISWANFQLLTFSISAYGWEHVYKLLLPCMQEPVIFHFCL